MVGSYSCLRDPLTVGYKFHFNRHSFINVLANNKEVSLGPYQIWSIDPKVESVLTEALCQHIYLRTWKEIAEKETIGWHADRKQNKKKPLIPSFTRRCLIMSNSFSFQNGLVLIDSPGIGENEAMDNIIEEFVENNPIMGFIYVIKSDQAGGVQEDRGM